MAMKSFNLAPGRRIGRHYRVGNLLGAGTEGEVYRITEEVTGIHRAAKLFFPTKRAKKISVQFARKLESMRRCEVVLHYYHTEKMKIRGEEVIAVISELCEGRPLQKWMDESRGA
ncbi:MAG: hypothetical protein R3236_04020, partial [Phycisphaeraceae bacterium]|nr:hypothetical protein [Phycisphaeraceae bacterium]